MSFGGFLDNTTAGGGGDGDGGVVGGGGARIVADIPYNNSMAPGAISHHRLVPPPSLNKSFFNSPGLSLALVISLSF